MSKSLSLKGGQLAPASQSREVAESTADGSSHARPPRNYLKVFLFLLFVVCVVLPTLFAGVYYWGVATPRYVSNAQVTVKSAGQGSVGEMSSLLGGLVSSSGSQEAFVVQEYVQSQDILNDLQSWLDLRKQWSQPSIDPISRLDPNASAEDFLTYYNSMVTASYDSEKSVINIAVQGYSREDANALATAIIELSDSMVNQMSDKIREDTLGFARGEVERAEQRLQEARVAMKRFQNKHGDLDPEQTASAIGGIIADLESRLAQVRTEMSAKSSYLRENSPAMKALKSQERAIQKQLAEERQRLTGEEQGSADGRGKNYSEVLVNYEQLRVEEELALKSYEAAQTALEAARAEASRKQMYLVSFVSPTMPDESTKPDASLNVLTAFLGGVATFAVLALIIGAVREHARF